MANVYLNTGALSLYQSSNGTSWSSVSGSSPYTLAVNKYYKLTASAPSSGQIFTEWTLSNNVDNIIQLTDKFSTDAVFNTLNQTWSYENNITIQITANYENEDTNFLNQRGLKDVINKVAKIQKVSEFPTESNAKENTIYIKCKAPSSEADLSSFLDLSELGKIFDAYTDPQGIDPSTLDNIRNIEDLITFLNSEEVEYGGTVSGNTQAAVIAQKYGFEQFPIFKYYTVE